MASAPVLDPVDAYRTMVRMRLVEEAVVAAWADGLVPGEYHSAIGEEGINAGVVMHLDGRDTMALDHRNTSPLIARGADPRSLMLEVMGSEAGMNNGWAGHMHLMEPDLHAAADGMVGASGPLAVGNAIALTRLHPGHVAVAFHGEAAMNQGMLMESYNMAVVWNLPVVFVCKNNKWSITTYSEDVTGGSIVDRARSFGLAVEEVGGDRVQDVFVAAGRLVDRARDGGGPGFLHATCHRPGGHFEGDPIVRLLKSPGAQAMEWGPGIRDGAFGGSGGTRWERALGVGRLAHRGVRAARDWTLRSRMDPIRRGRSAIGSATAERVEAQERSEISEAMAAARAEIGHRPVFGAPSREPS